MTQDGLSFFSKGQLVYTPDGNAAEISAERSGCGDHDLGHECRKTSTKENVLVDGLMVSAGYRQEQMNK